MNAHAGGNMAELSAMPHPMPIYGTVGSVPAYADQGAMPAVDYRTGIPLTPVIIPDQLGSFMTEEDAFGGGGGGGGFIAKKVWGAPLLLIIPLVIVSIVLLVVVCGQSLGFMTGLMFPKFAKGIFHVPEKPIITTEIPTTPSTVPYINYYTTPYAMPYPAPYDKVDNTASFNSPYLASFAAPSYVAYTPDFASYNAYNVTSDQFWRQKRESESAAPALSLAQVEKLTTVVFAALRSQECIQRLLCEAGGFSRSFSTANAAAKAIEKFVPDSLRPSYDIFASGENCDQFVCGNLSVKKW